MMTTCCAIVGLVFLVLTNLALIIAFATPYWFLSGQLARGLWAYCGHNTCTWVFQQQSGLQGQNTTWWLCTQGLMCVGLSLALLALMVATVSLCCQCKCCNTSHAVAALLVLTFLAVGVAVVVFGVCANQDLGVELDGLIHFAWSFWLSVTAAALALFSSLIYACESKTRYTYSNSC